MYRKTAWTKPTSTLPSDRIRPSHIQPPAPQNSKGKGKNAAKAAAPPKSKQVRRLEALLNALHASSGNNKDPKGGCFCLAREHPLSTYTPICRTCGLILCNLNLPQFSCPHCSSPTLTGAPRDTLISRIEAEISDTLDKEAWERERVVLEARQAAGSFPTLHGIASSQAPGSHPSAAPPPPANQTHKVLSLNSKTKKATISSFTTTPVASRPVSRAKSPLEEKEEGPMRVPPPPPEVNHARQRIDPARPWKDLRGGGARYIPLPAEDKPKPKSRKKRGKTKENDGSSVANTEA